MNNQIFGVENANLCRILPTFRKINIKKPINLLWLASHFFFF